MADSDPDILAQTIDTTNRLHRRIPSRSRLVTGILLLAISAAALCVFPFNRLKGPVPFNAAAAASSSDGTLFSITTPELYYTGTDSSAGSSPSGHWYYSLNNNSVSYYLMNDSNTTGTPASLKYSKAIICTAIQNNTLSAALDESLASSLDWSSQAVSSISSNYLFIEYTGPGTVFFRIALCFTCFFGICGVCCVLKH